MTCANNCKGVNPNAVVIGGTAILAAAAVTPLQVLSYTGLVAVTYNLKVRLSTGALFQVLQVGMGVATAGLGAAAIGQMVGGGACPATRPCNVRVAFWIFNKTYFIADAVSEKPLSPSVLQTNRTR